MVEGRMGTRTWEEPGTLLWSEKHLIYLPFPVHSCLRNCMGLGTEEFLIPTCHFCCPRGLSVSSLGLRIPPVILTCLDSVSGSFLVD